MDLGLKGKVAVVTGGSKGIGLGISQVLAEEGANLVINYRSGPEDAEKAARQIMEDCGVEVITVQGDAGEQATVDKVFDAAMEKFGTVDILVNNAGGGIKQGAFETLTDEQWFKTQQNSVGGQFLMCRKYVDYWKGLKRGGHIVNVVAKCCIISNSINNQAYTSAKGALLALTRSLANEVTPYGIYVNGINPGYVTTERVHTVGSERYLQKLPLLPTGKFATPRDMGNIVAFLCSPLAKQIIGTVIDCTGGTLL